jgi:hypothetical protein
VKYEVGWLVNNSDIDYNDFVAIKFEKASIIPPSALPKNNSIRKKILITYINTIPYFNP